MDKSLIEKSFEFIKIGCSSSQTDSFSLYADFLKEYNKNVNLTAITDDDKIAVKHFEDSAFLLKFVSLSGKSVIDVGTGAGFPGVPLKILCPDMSVTLLDSLQKRITFLQALCKKLCITADTVHMRAEDAGRGSLREAFDAAVSRAVAPLPVLCEYCLPLVSPGGYFYAYKGVSSDEETALAAAAISKLGGKTENVYEFCLSNGEKRKIIEIKKVSHTPTQYPRKPAQISKQSI